MRKLLWENNPDLGFWIDNDPVRFYFGTQFSPDLIAKIGINAPEWASLSLDPYSALHRIGDGYIIVIEVPPRWLMEHMDQRLNGNKPYLKDRLLDKTLFAKWGELDYEYYRGAVIRIVKQVPARYIVGYMEHR